MKRLSPAGNSQPFIPALPDAFVDRAPAGSPYGGAISSSIHCTIKLIIVYFPAHMSK
jgi:hypothetical protein